MYPQPQPKSVRPQCYNNSNHKNTNGARAGKVNKWALIRIRSLKTSIRLNIPLELSSQPLNYQHWAS